MTTRMTNEERRKLLHADPKWYNPNDIDLMKSSQDQYGSVAGIEVGHTWKSRKECFADKVHTTLRAGISGSSKHGAYSIVLSGGYIDDDDHGDVITYSGAGSHGDQDFTHHDNAALQRSCALNKPVRVVRGPSKDSVYAPEEGYRYDGLYNVTKAELKVGKGGTKVCLFELKRLGDQPAIPMKIPAAHSTS